ncbi:MAG: phosphoribosyltransferase family protein [Patescibacteria group bacterium]
MLSSHIFKDRTEAGNQLAAILAKFKGSNAIVLALPRGGVIVAKEISRALDLPLDIIVTRKIGAPENDEYAIGAIDIEGDGVFNESEKARIDKKWLEHKILAEKKEAERRWNTYRKGRGPLKLLGKTAIIVDDGIATGLTMEVAIDYAKRQGAQKVIIAVPVASPDTLYKFKDKAEIFALETPAFFSAVGEWYENFPQVSDEEVVVALAS